MDKATVSTKGQIAIPKRVRERLNLIAGSQLTINIQGETLVMNRLVREYPDWRTMRGMARGEGRLTEALMDERAADKARDQIRVQSR